MAGTLGMVLIMIDSTDRRKRMREAQERKKGIHVGSEEDDGGIEVTLDTDVTEAEDSTLVDQSETIENSDGDKIEGEKEEREMVVVDGNVFWKVGETLTPLSEGDEGIEEMIDWFSEPEPEKEYNKPIRPIIDKWEWMYEFHPEYDPEGEKTFGEYLMDRQANFERISRGVDPNNQILSGNFWVGEEMKKGEQTEVTKTFSSILDHLIKGSGTLGGLQNLNQKQMSKALNTMKEAWLETQPENIQQRFRIGENTGVGFPTGVSEDAGKEAAIDYLGKKFIAKEKAEGELQDILSEAAKKVSGSN